MIFICELGVFPRFLVSQGRTGSAAAMAWVQQGHYAQPGQYAAPQQYAAPGQYAPPGQSADTKVHR